HRTQARRAIRPAGGAEPGAGRGRSHPVGDDARICGNRGRRGSVEPYAIRAVRNGDRALFTRQKSQLQPASNPAPRAAIHDVLASVVGEGTGRAARINGPVEGKTGTSQNYKDAWFIGFTNDIVVGVWVGNDDNRPTRGVTGGDLPARIWNEFVTQSATARAKAVRAQPRIAGLFAPAPADAKPGPSGTIIRGVPVVQSTGMLEIRAGFGNLHRAISGASA